VERQSNEGLDYSRIASLGVNELRQILQRHNVSYFDCIEKKDLIDKVFHVLTEKEKESPQPKEVTTTKTEKKTNDEKDLCIICLDSPISTVFFRMWSFGNLQEMF